ncbi:MAG: ABC transporter permease [Acidimicrobiia bacterium]|nr:ABC transporter permease [Acidimicrobiia bacterium]
MAERTPAPLLVGDQIRYQNRVFWRTPVAAFFTLFFPLFFLLLFSVLFGDQGDIDLGDRGVFSVAQFYAPGLAVFAAASATYTNLAVGTAIARDQGILKRFVGTPLPPWMYLAGRVGSAVWIALIGVVVMMSVGALAFDVQVSFSTLPAAALTFAVGAAAFAALGLAVAGLAPNGDSAPAVANATILPLAFVSDVFLAIEDPPAWLDVVGDIFPLKHFVRAFQDAFSPFTTDAGFRWGHLGVMVLWGVIGVVLAVRTFGWDPRESSGSRRGRRRRVDA